MVELAMLERRHLEKSPALQARRARVEAMHTIVHKFPAACQELLEAHADLASAVLRWGPNNPKLVDLQAKVAAYDKYLLGDSAEAFGLRLARAQHAHLSQRLGPAHPRILELEERIGELQRTPAPTAP